MAKPEEYRGHEILCHPKKTSRKSTDLNWVCELSILRLGEFIGSSRIIKLDATDVSKARQAGFAHAKKIIDRQILLGIFNAHVALHKENRIQHIRWLGTLRHLEHCDSIRK